MSLSVTACFVGSCSQQSRTAAASDSCLAARRLLQAGGADLELRVRHDHLLRHRTSKPHDRVPSPQHRQHRQTHTFGTPRSRYLNAHVRHCIPHPGLGLLQLLPARFRTPLPGVRVRLPRILLPIPSTLSVSTRPCGFCIRVVQASVVSGTLHLHWHAPSTLRATRKPLARWLPVRVGISKRKQQQPSDRGAPARSRRAFAVGAWLGPAVRI